jgi:hypothetical protein
METSMAANPDRSETVYKLKTGNVPIRSPAGPNISIEFRLSSTIAPKLGTIRSWTFAKVQYYAVHFSR